MSKIVWDASGQHFFETGVDKGVLYVFDSTVTSGTPYVNGVAWNGLISVNENPSGGEPTAFYADNMKYLNIQSAEEFAATIEAYYYPDEFAECDGSAWLLDGGMSVGQQTRKTFGLCYRTKIGNDTDGDDHGYKIHIIYGCLAAPSSKDYQTINETPEATTLSWEISTTPVDVTINNVTYKPTAHIVIDSTKADSTKLGDLEDILYGTSSTEPSLPLPDVIYDTLD